MHLAGEFAGKLDPGPIDELPQLSHELIEVGGGRQLAGVQRSLPFEGGETRLAGQLVDHDAGLGVPGGRGKFHRLVPDDFPPSSFGDDAGGVRGRLPDPLSLRRQTALQTEIELPLRESRILPQPQRLRQSLGQGREVNFAGNLNTVILLGRLHRREHSGQVQRGRIRGETCRQSRHVGLNLQLVQQQPLAGDFNPSAGAGQAD